MSFLYNSITSNHLNLNNIYGRFNLKFHAFDIWRISKSTRTIYESHFHRPSTYSNHCDSYLLSYPKVTLSIISSTKINTGFALQKTLDLVHGRNSRRYITSLCRYLLSQNHYRWGKLTENTEFSSSFLPYKNGLIRKLSFHSFIKQRLKWILTKNRPWSLDDKLALGSWIFLAIALFILFGTTTFVSSLIFLTNLFNSQDYFIRTLENYLKKLTGFAIKIDAITPSEKGFMITLKNISIDTLFDNNQSASNPSTVYSLLINEMTISLSLLRFLEGRGIVHTCKASGIRGTMDRRIVDAYRPIFRYSYKLGDFQLQNVDIEDMSIFIKYPPGYRSYELAVHKATIPELRKQWLLYDILQATTIHGSFDNCLFTLKTPTVEMKTPGDSVSGGATSIKKFERMRHIKVDGIKIDHVNASSTGPLSWISRGTIDFNAIILLPPSEKETDMKPTQTLLMNLTDMLNDLRQNLLAKYSEDSSSPTSMIQPSIQPKMDSGFPTDNIFDSLVDIESDVITMENILRGLIKWVNNDVLVPLIATLSPEWTSHNKEVISSSHLYQALNQENWKLAHRFIEADRDKMVMHLDIKLRNLRASVPYYSDNLSFLDNTLIKPIVGYINEHRPGISLSCTFDMLKDEFNGSWTPFDANLSKNISDSVYYSFAHLVQNEKRNPQIYKRIGRWGLYSIGRQLGSWYDYLSDFST